MALPSLNALRAFEAAGRLGSFASAADELGVTPGAVSRQIKVLEETFNMRLFVRGYREVRLTQEAMRYRDQLTEAFRRIHGATDELVQAARERPLCIMSPMNVAMRWLMPRLARFDLANPSIPLTITTLPGLGNDGTFPPGADVVLHLHSMRDPVPGSTFLFGNELVLVASPRLIQAGPPIERPADLACHTILVSAMRPRLWRDFFELVGEPDLEPAEMITLESSSMTTSAAIEGIGLALCDRVVLSDEMGTRLVQTLPHVLKSEQGFFLTVPNPPGPAPLRKFVNWLVEEARAVRGQFGMEDRTGATPDNNDRLASLVGI